MAKAIITLDDAEYDGLHAQGVKVASLRENGDDVWYRRVTDNGVETWYLIPKQTEKSSFGQPLVVDGIIFQAPYNPENVPEESE